MRRSLTSHGRSDIGATDVRSLQRGRADDGTLRRKERSKILLLLVAASAVVASIPSASSIAEHDAERSRPAHSTSHKSGDVGSPARVQPRALEFMPPYGQPDLSPENANEVDRLYEKLTHPTETTCPQPSSTPTREERC